MPLYNDIADAFEFVADGTTHTVSLDNTGATFQTNENGSFPNPAEPQPGVWAKIDLSGYVSGTTYDVPIDLVRTGGDPAFAPEFAVFKIVDASFDPTAPDFTKLEYIGGGQNYVGDGTTDPPSQTLNLIAGTGSSTGARSQTGIFYMVFNDYNYAVTGTGDAAYSVPTAPVCFDAVDIINLDSPTASVVSGRVREDWLDWWDFGSNGYLLPQATFKFTWADAPGLYLVQITGQLSANGGGQVMAIASVNGRAFLGTRNGTGNNTTPFSWFLYNGFNAATPHVYNPSDFDQAPWLVLSPGDVVEIMIMSNANLTGFSGFNPFETSSICFMVDPTAPVSTFCMGSVNFENSPPLGDDWGDVDGWGGQRLIPDEIYAIPANQPGPDDPHTPGVDFPWGVNQVDFDFVALEDGTVYVLIHDSSPQSSGGTTPSNDRHWLAVKKYDPGAGTWSQVATLNIRDPNDRYQLYGVTAETDGTFVYFAWWELTTYTPGAPNLLQSDWHLVRLDPSDDSTTELGTGQHSINAGTAAGQSIDNAELGASPAILAPSICFSGDDIYVGVVELVITVASPLAEWRRPYVWRWDGATWTDLALPTPSLLGPNTTQWEITGENQFWDQLIEMVAADQNGPITDGVTVIYSYLYRDGSAIDRYPSVTIPYTTGGGWGTEILTDWMTLEVGRQGTVIAPPDNVYRAMLVDHTIMWSTLEGKLVLTGDLLTGPDGGIWDTWIMNDNGDAWEIREPIAPANAAGGWRQTRNSAAIGPDGFIYRAMMSEDVANALNFQPHVIKHSPGFNFGYINAARKAIGKKDSWEDPQGILWSGAYISMYSTTNYRIRWVGNSCYIMGNLYNEPQLVNDTLFADYAGDWPYGEGFFVIKGTYVPCGGNIPLFRPRVFSLSTGA